MGACGKNLHSSHSGKSSETKPPLIVASLAFSTLTGNRVVPGVHIVGVEQGDLEAGYPIRKAWDKQEDKGPLESKSKHFY